MAVMPELCTTLENATANTAAARFSYVGISDSAKSSHCHKANCPQLSTLSASQPDNKQWVSMPCKPHGACALK
jgi:hypothetical protein